MRNWQRTAWASLVVAAAGAVVVSTFAADAPAAGAKKRILVYGESDGFRHSVMARPLDGSLSHAEKVLKEVLTKAGFEVCFSQSFHDLVNEGQFNHFDAIILYTTGEPKIDRASLMKWLRSGKALIGLHAATDTFKADPEFIKMIGGTFRTHGAGDKEVTVKVENSNHPSTKMLPASWVIADEIYQFNSFAKDNVQMLMSIDNSKTDLGPQNMKAEEYYPVAWTRSEGKGRVFYTSLGHREDVWTNPLYQQHVLGGIQWAMGLAEAK